MTAATAPIPTVAIPPEAPLRLTRALLPAAPGGGAPGGLGVARVAGGRADLGGRRVAVNPAAPRPV